MQTTIRKWGNSVGARIPLTLLEAVGLNVNDTVDIEIVDGQLILKQSVKETALEDLLALSPEGAFDLNEEDKQWLSSPAVGHEVI